MAWTILNSGDPINSGKFKDVLNELKTALNEREDHVGVSETSFPTVSGGRIDNVMRDYRNLLRSGIDTIVAQGVFYELFGGIFPSVSAVLEASDGPDVWDTNYVRPNRGVWRQFQQVFDELKFLRFSGNGITSGTNGPSTLLKRTQDNSSPNPTNQEAWDAARTADGFTQTDPGELSVGCGWSVIPITNYTWDYRIRDNLTVNFDFSTWSVTPSGTYVGHQVALYPLRFQPEEINEHPEFQIEDSNIWDISNGDVFIDVELATPINFGQLYPLVVNQVQPITTIAPFTDPNGTQTAYTLAFNRDTGGVIDPNQDHMTVWTELDNLTYG